MTQKIIEKSILSNWLLNELIKNYKPTPNYTVLPGYRVFKILKFLKLHPFNRTTGKQTLPIDDFELHCILSDSNHSIIAKISRETIYQFEKVNKARITENTVNTIIMVKDTKLEWISRQQLVSEFEVSLGSDFVQQLDVFSKRIAKDDDDDEDDDRLIISELQSFAILRIDNDTEFGMTVLDMDQDRINRVIKPVYFTDKYVKVIKPFSFKANEEFMM